MPASVVVRKTAAAQPSPAAPAASTSRHGPPCSCPGQGCVLSLEPPIFLSLTFALLLSFWPLLTSKSWLGDPSGSPATVASAGLCLPVLSLSMNLPPSTCRDVQPAAHSPFEGIWWEVHRRLERSCEMVVDRISFLLLL